MAFWWFRHLEQAKFAEAPVSSIATWKSLLKGPRWWKGIPHVAPPLSSLAPSAQPNHLTGIPNQWGSTGDEGPIWEGVGN